MFTINPFGDDDLVVPAPSATSSEWWAIQPIILWPSGKNPSIRVGDPPVTGKLHAFHDRDCSHLNVKGELVASGNLITSTVIPTRLGPTDQQHLSGPLFRDLVKYTVTYNKVNPSSPQFVTGYNLVYYGKNSSEDYSPFSFVNLQYGVIFEYQDARYESIWVDNSTLIVRYSEAYRLKRNDPSGTWSVWKTSYSAHRYVFSIANGKPVSGQFYLASGERPSATFNWSNVTFTLQSSTLRIYTVASCGSLLPGPFNKIDIDLHDWFWSLSQVIPAVPRNMWGDLAQKATDDVKAVDINSPMYVKDLFAIKEAIMPLVGAIRHPSIKKVSRAYLAVHYGISLTYKDTKELIKACKKAYSSERPHYTCVRSQDNVSGTSPFAGRRIGYSDSYFYKIYYDPLDGTFFDICRKMFNWDFFPSLQNCWDIIPFSFVVDWIIDVESFFSRIDTKTYICTLNVQSVLRTRKITYDSIDVALLERPLLGMTLSGKLSVTYYDRAAQRNCDIPSPRFDVPTSFNNWVEASALFVTKMR